MLKLAKDLIRYKAVKEAVKMEKKRFESDDNIKKALKFIADKQKKLSSEKKKIYILLGAAGTLLVLLLIALTVKKVVTRIRIRKEENMLIGDIFDEIEELPDELENRETAADK